MKIQGWETPYWRSVTYLVEENGRACMVDPCELDAVKAYIRQNNLTLDYALLTHEHCDHITGVSWAQSLGAKAVCTDTCANYIKSPAKNAAFYFNEFSKIQEKLACGRTPIPENFACHADITFDGMMRLTWQGHTLQLVATPGHSPGCMCVLLDDGVLFSGDTLLGSEPTNTRFPGGSRAQLRDVTMPWLKTLSPDLMVYPGHFTPFSLRDQTGGIFRKECKQE